MRLSLPAAKDWRDNRGWIPGVHRGQDFGWGAGDQVYAAAPGKVVEVYAGGAWNGGWGNRVVIDHGGNNYTTYNHLSRVDVRLNQLVARGETIALMGSTGNSTAKHLHFELERGGRSPQHRVDPAPYYTADLPGTGADPSSSPSQEDDMAYLITTDKGDILVVDHNQMTFWNVHEGVSAAQVPKRIQWLKDQGAIREVHGHQPASLLNGYRHVAATAPVGTVDVKDIDVSKLAEAVSVGLADELSKRLAE